MRRRLFLFPLPWQGHLTPMLQLANILHSSGFSISIIHTQYNAPNRDFYPHFTFHSIPETLFEYQASIKDVIALMNDLNVQLVEPFEELLGQILSENNAAAKEGDDNVACLITDALWYFTQAVADSFKLPRVVLRTSNVSCFCAFLRLPLFRDKGYFSAKGTELDADLREFPPLKVKDIPILGTQDTTTTYEIVCNMVESTKASKGLIFNTSEELEGPSLARIRQEIAIPVFAIGPFHKQVPTSSSSLLKQDKSCISWLNAQAPKSVLYVSFGSVAAIDEQGFQEIAWGLANSKQPFLWVIRPGLVKSSTTEPAQLPDKFMEIAAERGRIVEWAPQEEVLAHPAVGGFWTHCGWNSTLESICEGVPMLCLPCFGDQMLNARYVTDVWKVGLRFENELRRDDIEKAIRRLILDKEGEEMRQRIAYLKDKACSCITAGGSSYSSSETLANYISFF